jgi:hypothetical protein
MAALARWFSPLSFAAVLVAGALPQDTQPPPTSLQFKVSVAPEVVTNPPQSGRLIVVISQGAGRRGEPRLSIGRTGMDAPPILGVDADEVTANKTFLVDAKADIFPMASLAQLQPGEYTVQAVLMTNRDIYLPSAEGNLYSKPVQARLDPAQGGTVELRLTEKVAPETLPQDTPTHKFVKMQSKLLSAFHGRPMYLRAGIILPQDFEQQPAKKYPLRVHIGGYGTRFTAARFFRPSAVLTLVLDGAGPFGDPYQVNSANTGPLGDAITQELIPLVEKQYRGIGQGYARFTDGGSTGGWVSLALQIFYPDFFNGCWSQCPDPVDFRCYELINIYQDENAYVNRYGFERPAKRNVNGDTIYTVRHECQVENVLGRGGRWQVGGKDWCAWNATFGPRGSDGLPRPLWDPKTGKIDRSVTPHWEKYDLRLVLERNWATLGPKLRGKIHIWVGDADDYFLNNAVHLFKAATQRWRNPPFDGVIEIVMRQPHTSGWRDNEILQQMLKRTHEGGR